MLDGISMMCFGASYTLALVLELIYLFRPRMVLRLFSLGFGSAGLLAHTLFLAHLFFFKGQPASLAAATGSMVFLAWILAVFYLYGSVHHRRLAWGVFVLPLVLALTALARVFGSEAAAAVERAWPPSEVWGTIHGILLILAAVGVSVGCVASVMYLIQARQLKAKMLPGEGLRLLSLERLEAMNRRAINWAFPLLTAGLLAGIPLMVIERYQLQHWTDWKIVSTLVLWVVCALLLFLRYGYRLRGRHLARLTIVVFVLLVCTLAFTHPSVRGGGP
jgi:ABC-type transport system involved in cytochrome c biogenesis permease subunit